MDLQEVRSLLILTSRAYKEFYKDGQNSAGISVFLALPPVR